jgi:hypothetical protein
MSGQGHLQDAGRVMAAAKNSKNRRLFKPGHAGPINQR